MEDKIGGPDQSLARLHGDPKTILILRPIFSGSMVLPETSIELQGDFFKLSGLPHPPHLLFMAIQSTVVWLIACESQSRMVPTYRGGQRGNKLGWKVELPAQHLLGSCCCR